MSELLDFARERLGKVIEVTLPGRDAPSKVQVRVPVGTDAVEFMADVRGVMASNDSLTGAADGGGDKAKLAELADDLAKAVTRFAAKWIPRLVEDLAGANAADVATLVRRTGGNDSPFIKVLYDMVPPAATGTEEGLEALPFS